MLANNPFNPIAANTRLRADGTLGVHMETFDGFPLKRGFAGPGWVLEDCTAAALRSPETFKIPDVAEAALVRIGDLLRLHFMLTDPSSVANPDVPRAERMWVEVCSLSPDKMFRGHLTNKPVYIDSLAPGDVIEFAWQHVAQVYVRKDDPRWVDERA